MNTEIQNSGEFLNTHQETNFKRTHHNRWEHLKKQTHNPANAKTIKTQVTPIELSSTKPWELSAPQNGGRRPAKGTSKIPVGQTRCRRTQPNKQNSNRILTKRYIYNDTSTVAPGEPIRLELLEAFFHFCYHPERKEHIKIDTPAGWETGAKYIVTVSNCHWIRERNITQCTTHICYPVSTSSRQQPENSHQRSTHRGHFAHENHRTRMLHKLSGG